MAHCYGKGRRFERRGAARTGHGRIRHGPMRRRCVWHRHVRHRCATLLLATSVQIYRLAMNAAGSRNGGSCYPHNDHGESSPRAARNDHGLPQAACCSNTGMRRMRRREHTFSVRVPVAEPQGRSGCPVDAPRRDGAAGGHFEEGAAADGDALAERKSLTTRTNFAGSSKKGMWPLFSKTTNFEPGMASWIL